LAERRDNAFLIMPDRAPLSRLFSHIIFRSSLALVAAVSISACNNSAGPAVALTLTLYTIDGNFLPAAIKNTDGRTFTIGVGRLQGTDLGPSCGMSLQLITGPITSAEVPGCKLVTGEEFKFTATLSDPRFPTGPHQYRFVPP
jgi:hypothetical protein